MRVSTRRLLLATALTGTVGLGAACTASLAGIREDSAPPAMDYEPVFTGEEGTGGAGYGELDYEDPGLRDTPLNAGGNPVGSQSFLPDSLELESEPEKHRIFGPEDPLEHDGVF